MRRAPQQPGPGPYRSFVAALRPFMSAISTRDWRGAEHLPPPGVGFIAASNHTTYLDPLTLTHFLYDNGRPPRFLAKAAILEVPVVGALIRNTGQIPVLRETTEAGEALVWAVQGVLDGECVAIYPEATLTRDPDLWPMRGKTGAARVALQTGCPVVPIAQWGPHKILRPYGKVLRPVPRTTVHVHAGPPVQLADLADKPLTAALLAKATDRIMAGIVALLEAIRGETAPTVRFDPTAARVPPTGNPRRGRR